MARFEIQLPDGTKRHVDSVPLLNEECAFLSLITPEGMEVTVIDHVKGTSFKRLVYRASGYSPSRNYGHSRQRSPVDADRAYHGAGVEF